MATSTLGSGTLVLAGTTSGTTTVTATAVAGTTTLTLPAATDTLVGKATTDTLTNKTLTSPTLTGVATFAAGTAAAPAITTTGDTNTGIWFPAADTIAFTEGGVESMRIDSSGNLGLGVTPLSWSGYKSLDLQGGSFASGSGTNVEMWCNAYYNGTNSVYRNTGYATLYNQSSGTHKWYNAPSGTGGATPDTVSFTQAMTLDASGNLLVGATSPTGRLTVADSTTSVLTLRATSAVDADGRVIGTLNFQEPEGTGDGTLAIEAAISGLRSGTDSFNSGGRLAFYTRPFNGTLTQAMTLDASGRLGIGTTSPGSILDVQDAIGATRVTVTNTANAAAGAGVNFIVKNGATTVGNGTIRTDNADNLAFFNIGGERMRIDTSGNLLVGTTANAITAYSASKSLVQSADYSGSVAQLINSTSTTGTQYFLAFGRGASVCGQITSGSTNSTSFTTSSDYRLKKDVQPITGALAKVQTLKPCTYKWVEDNTISEGFIAHELAETFPQAVVGEKDAVNAEGNPVYQGVDTSFLVATLTAAIQELKALTDTQASTITALTARIEALENK